MSTNDDSDLLDIIRKDRDGAVQTTAALAPWQEPVRRAAASAPGFGGGSWAASWRRDEVALDDSTARPSAHADFVRNQLGLPGFPEVNFRPYDRETNRVGARGPSLLGRPVSFSFVGPTGQAGPMLDIQWALTDNSALPGQGDLVAIDTASPRSTPSSGLLGPNYGVTPSILDLYGLQTLPAQGLYLVVAMTGSPGEQAGAAGGLGDWTVGSDGSRSPVAARRPESRFEVFRVSAIQGIDTLVLDPGKRLAAHFQFPGLGVAAARLVLLLRPEAARLVPLPARDGRRPRAYAFLPPARSLCSDLQPPLQTWVFQDPQYPTWWSSGVPIKTAGNVNDYGEGVLLPVGRPSGMGEGRLQGELADPTPTDLGIGRWGFYHQDGSGDAPAQGQVVRVYQTDAVGGASIWSTSKQMVADPGLDRLLGWYEVAQVVPASPGLSLVVCRRLAEPDPSSGIPFDSTPDAFWLDSPVAGQRVVLRYTLHDPVSSLWAGPLDPDVLESTRLRPLLPPELAGRSARGWPEPAGQTAARPDRAALDTATAAGGFPGTCADPGSLLDLGFRAVVYPARVGASGALEPDFDRPLCSREVVCDPQAGGEQSLEVDYESGVLRLSVPPNPGPGCEVCPDVATLTATDNPRGEVVLFASFVAASVENGGALSVYGATDPDIQEDPCGTSGFDTAAPFSARVPLPLAVQTITVPAFPNRIDLLLDQVYDPLLLPPSGVVELVQGSSPEGPPLFPDPTPGERASTFHYESVGTWSAAPPKVKLVGCTGGGVPGASQAVTSVSPALAVMRKRYGVTGTGPRTDYRADLCYGAGARAEVLRFPGARVRWLGDGTASVDTRTNQDAPLFHDLFAPAILEGCLASTPGGLVVQVSPGWVLVQGRRVPVRSRITLVPDNAVTYVYLVGRDPCDVRPATSTVARALPGRDDLLLAKVTARAGSIVDLVDLRYPLREVDYRIDVIVGQRVDLFPYAIPEPHFSTLAAAVRYVGELVSPTAGIAGYQVRIRVVGPTREFDLPIVIPADGITVEGVTPSQFSGAALWGVGWTHPTSPLFDLNGRSECTFRDLHLEYVSAGQPLDPRPERVAFTNLATSAISDRILLDNVTLNGNNLAHGMLDTPAGTGGFTRLTLRTCKALGVTDFGVRLDNSTGLVAQGCLFQQGGVAQTAGPGLAGVSLGLTGATQPGNFVSKTTCVGFPRGFFTSGTRDSFEECTANRSLGPGFVVGTAASQGITLDRCVCVAAFVDDPTPLPRIGISVDGGPDVVVNGCRVDLFATTPGDLGLFTAVPVRVSDFTTSAGVHVGVGSVLSKVFCAMELRADAGCILSDCEADSVNLGATCRVRGFEEQGTGASTMMNGCQVESSRFSGLTVPVGDCRIVQCDIGTLVLGPAFAVSVVGGRIRNALAMSGDLGELRGVLLDKALTVTGSRCLVEGCTFSAGVDVVVRPPAPPARIQQVVLRNNRFLGNGGIWLDADQSRVEDNEVPSFQTTSGTSLSIVAQGQQLFVKGNRALFGIGVGVPTGGLSPPPTSECVVNGNWASDLRVEAPRSVVAGNVVNNLTVTEDCVVSGGRATKVEVLKSWAIITGCSIGPGGVQVDAQGYLVSSGCQVTGPLILPTGGSRSVISGSRLAAVTVDGHLGTVLSGNSSGAVSANQAHQSVFSGNSVVAGGIQAKASLVVIVGNSTRDADILLPKDVPASFVVVGNQARNIVADGGVDPDPVIPQKSMVTGNRADKIFGGTPDGQGRRNNVSP